MPCGAFVKGVLCSYFFFVSVLKCSSVSNLFHITCSSPDAL